MQLTVPLLSKLKGGPVHRGGPEIQGDLKTLTSGLWTPLLTRSMDYLMDRSTDFFYEPPYRPPQNIAGKKKKIAKKLTEIKKDLTYHMNRLSALVGENLNANFLRINRLGCKVMVIIAYCHLFRCGNV